MLLKNLVIILSHPVKGSFFLWFGFHLYDSHPIAQWMCKLSQPTQQTLRQQNRLIYLPSLIFKSLKHI
jgi:hypothetical protein